MAVDVKTAEARSRARKLYFCVALLEALLMVTILILAGISLIYESRETGLPYYTGGFIVGGFMVIGSLTAWLVFWRTKQAIFSDHKHTAVGCLLTAHYVLTILTMMGCFLAVILTGMYGLCEVPSSCHSENLTTNKNLAIALACCIIIAFFTNVVAMVTVCTYGSYFGVNFKHHGRHHVTIWHSQMLHSRSNRVSDSPVSSNIVNNPQNSTNSAVQTQLQQQNMLLLQQNQLLLQQQQQQQQQTGPSGVYPPVDVEPPPYESPVPTTHVRPFDEEPRAQSPPILDEKLMNKLHAHK